jgi:hypothetical protein
MYGPQIHTLYGKITKKLKMYIIKVNCGIIKSFVELFLRERAEKKQSIILTIHIIQKSAGYKRYITK